MSQDLPEGAVPTGREETEEARVHAENRLGELSKIVVALHPMLEEPIVVHSGSSLAADDKAYPEYPTSNIAWTGVGASIDALSTFFAALAGNRTAYATGHRVTARAALNGAAQALFVLAPPARIDRTKHALRLAKDDLDSYERAMTEMRNGPLQVGTPEVWAQTMKNIAERQKTLSEVASRVGMSRTKLKEKPELGKMVKYALSRLPDEEPTGPALRAALQMTLAQLNSAAHTGRWHVLRGVTHTMDTPEGPRARVVTTTTDLSNMVAGPVLLLQQALDLYVSRAQPH